ncbi:hypothetical protein PVAND_007293 [Polypedilum vanderplanki]|uniref:Mitochondrial assembly of ribosomal large subunit protein 1 n=1 Tax=Polypedilum vanderplanki TaxID=319348 RepID=A0A9J6B8Q8_POLVA|nr:hypothetical protein PVAND_017786 [Polypedilum vanderplanki]KAG5677541.1 hypothetical protein PVAND_007293 [Polypedilum vanderplanki]
MLRRIKTIHKFCNIRTFRHSAVLRKNQSDDGDKKDLSSSIATKFQVFKNESVGIIFDVEEERARRMKQIEEGISEEDEQQEQSESIPSIYADLNLERGKTGVFDIEDLVELLKKENAIDLCVIKIAPELSYVDYMVIATGSTYRHMLGMSSFVRKVYKMKRNKNDPIPKIEGETCKNWMAMDLGNIALHIFSQSAREYYNLESLWLLGEEYEKKIRGRDAPNQLYEQFFNPSQKNNEVIEKEEESIAKS